MNRTIKFRAWDKEHKKMVDDVYNHAFYKSLNDCLKNSELMQYTGLKDKNGKEIYEGDIVYYGELNHEVFWLKSGWELENKNGMWTPTDSDWDDVEVIGNRYENPELLEI